MNKPPRIPELSDFQPPSTSSGSSSNLTNNNRINNVPHMMRFGMTNSGPFFKDRENEVKPRTAASSSKPNFTAGKDHHQL